MKAHILVVEDDPHIRFGLREALRSESYRVTECDHGGKAVSLIKQAQPDLILLDVMLPGKSGYDLCRELREQRVSIPIVMLTAKGQEIDKVTGLKLGADDYITKPFGVQELLARIQSVLRRAGHGEQGRPMPLPAEIRFGKVVIRPAALRGTNDGKPFELSARELKVLSVLYRDAGNVVDRDRLLNDVWGRRYFGTTRTLDQVIVKLRQKLEPHPSRPRHILTVHAVGYRLEKSPRN